MLYISELIGEKYRTWGKGKVFLTAPTGLGKTTFILSELLPYLQARKKKLLILCNRKLLRDQYWYAAVQKFDNYGELASAVDIMTYQSLAEVLKNDGSLKDVLFGYEVICCDEAHYFYADSDFNGFGTYVMLQALILTGLSRQMIFMSGTMKEVQPLISQTLKAAIEKRKSQLPYFPYEEYGREYMLDFSYLADYSRFECYYSEDIDTLCDVIAKDRKKTVFFIDNKKRAAEIKEKCIKQGKLNSAQIKIFNAENLEENCNQETVKKLVMCNSLEPQILITTSVLDNGVSIQDEEVGNAVIVTDSQISFLQMLGRIRAGYGERIKLIFLLRDVKEFEKKELKYEKDVHRIEEIDNIPIDLKRFKFLSVVWEQSDVELADFYRKILVCTKREFECYLGTSKKAELAYGDSKFCINNFAKEKIGNDYLLTSRFHVLAMKDSKNVIYEQMKWIGKEKGELAELTSDYWEKRRAEYRKDLLIPQKFTNEQMQEWKISLTEQHRKIFFSDIVEKNGSFSKEKLKKILARESMELIEDDSDGRKTYSIEEVIGVLTREKD